MAQKSETALEADMSCLVCWLDICKLLQNPDKGEVIR